MRLLKENFYLNDNFVGELESRCHSDDHSGWIFTLTNGIIMFVPFCEIKMIELHPEFDRMNGFNCVTKKSEKENWRNWELGKKVIYTGDNEQYYGVVTERGEDHLIVVVVDGCFRLKMWLDDDTAYMFHAL